MSWAAYRTQEMKNRARIKINRATIAKQLTTGKHKELALFIAIFYNVPNKTHEEYLVALKQMRLKEIRSLVDTGEL